MKTKIPDAVLAAEVSRRGLVKTTAIGGLAMASSGLGNVNAPPALARPALAVVFTKPRGLPSAGNTASGIFVFIMAHSSLLTIGSSYKPFWVIISIAVR